MIAISCWLCNNLPLAFFTNFNFPLAQRKLIVVGYSYLRWRTWLPNTHTHNYKPPQASSTTAEVSKGQQANRYGSGFLFSLLFLYLCLCLVALEWRIPATWLKWNQTPANGRTDGGVNARLVLRKRSVYSPLMTNDNKHNGCCMHIYTIYMYMNMCLLLLCSCWWDSAATFPSTTLIMLDGVTDDADGLVAWHCWWGWLTSCGVCCVRASELCKRIRPGGLSQYALK